MLQDRRQYQRVIPDQPLLVRCGESQCRLLFDLSEEGLAIDDLGSEISAQVIPLVFDLPDGHGHIQARGEIAWTDDSEKRTGLRFVDLADTSRQQLRQWISASVFDTTELALAEEEPAQPSAFLTHQTDSVDFRAPQPMPYEGLSRYVAPHYLTWLVLGALSLSAGVAFIHHFLGGTGSSWRTKEIMAAGKLPEIPPAGPSASAKRSPVTTPSLPPTLPLDVPGFVLQVAAMKHEDNADALARTLQKRNFPAFVFKRGANPFYRVAVGAYGDPSSAVRVKDQLKAQGFRAILKRWSPT
ncbi:MAG TPA: SPOR domain-containing protein [Candidatus Acidoferrales bacterium]|nr:SPOR domain-containing protein [Candidatus Acidoferrales bacterium]